MSQNVAMALRVARAVCNLSQAKAAARAGVSSSTLSLLESGKRTPSVDTIAQLARAYGLTPIEFSLLCNPQYSLDEPDLCRQTLITLGTWYVWQSRTS